MVIFRACIIFALVLPISLGGCASVPSGSVILQKQAKGMSPPDGWCGIYVFRPSMPPGDTLWGVNLDSKHFGYLAPKSYLYGVIQPGQHELDLEYSESKIRFEAKKGMNHYFRIVLGFPGAVIATIGAVEAKKLMDEYTLSALNIFENEDSRKMFSAPEQQ